MKSEFPGSAGQTLIGPRVFAAVEEAVLTEPVGNLELQGFGKPVAAYEVRGPREGDGRRSSAPGDTVSGIAGVRQVPSRLSG